MRAAAAIADPVRRQILEMLRENPARAGDIAARFTISRPAISRHLRILRESGLVSDTVAGRQRTYRVDAAPLREIAYWIATFEPRSEAIEWSERASDAARIEAARIEAARIEAARIEATEPWTQRLDALETEVARTRRERKAQPRSEDHPEKHTEPPTQEIA